MIDSAPLSRRGRLQHDCGRTAKGSELRCTVPVSTYYPGININTSLFFGAHSLSGVPCLCLEMARRMRDPPSLSLVGTGSRYPTIGAGRGDRRTSRKAPRLEEARVLLSFNFFFFFFCISLSSSFFFSFFP